MDPLILARLQFAITTVYHFFFVPLTLGLSVMVALMETMYVRTGQQVYKDMTKFWGKLFLINFAMGVVTGIVQEFQFGMNWSEYSRFVGDIFGAPLAIEALLAFFLESTLLGVWIFGWEKLSRGAHAAVMWGAAIGANLSAIWILIANAFMQQPTGYVLNLEAGRAEMVDFLALILNPTALVMIPHTLAAGFATASFFILGISAYHLLRKQDVEVFRRSFSIAAIVGALAVLVVGLNGHTQTQHLVQTQPMKMAAAEALWYSQKPGSFSLITIGNLAQTEDVFSLRLPGMLSFLAYNNWTSEVQGINNLQAQYEQTYGPGNYIPPIAVTYWSFRIMVGAGLLMVVLAVYALFQVMSESLGSPSRFLRVFLWAMLLPYLATTTGWLMTELGRYPWVVVGLMRIEQGVSTTVPGWQVLVSLLGYTLVYAALMVADIYLLVKYARVGVSALPTAEVEAETVPSLAGGYQGTGGQD
jgi:cytochrome bd ubiquinol oxidase subunit I